MNKRILAVSDHVVKHLYAADVAERYGDVDLVLSCGDLPFYYLEFLVSALDKQLLYVRGNHDGGTQFTSTGRALTEVQGGIDIHGQVVFVEGLLIAGLEGSMRYQFNAPYMYTEREMTWNVLRLVPRLLLNVAVYGKSLDILVTHSPPYRIHDGRDVAHTGFKIFRLLLERFKPRFLLHGHMHVHRGTATTVTLYKETTVINVFPYRLLEFEMND